MMSGALSPNTKPLRNVENQAPGDEMGFRRQSDEIMWQLMQDKYNSLTRDVKELTVTLRGYNGDVGLVGRITQIETRLESIYNILSTRHAAGHFAEMPEGDRPLTSARMAEKFISDWFKPVVTGIVTAVVLAAILHLLK